MHRRSYFSSESEFSFWTQFCQSEPPLQVHGCSFQQGCCVFPLSMAQSEGEYGQHPAFLALQAASEGGREGAELDHSSAPGASHFSLFTSIWKEM
ncbi:hypothetical protein CRENBAI_013328 [Crenichthys baileyi]|uniref:Uncharacterized protein n=1 Tax=Crenichthys baileyi TaxID=28760 RepID=A0AAV9R7B9_9TELE